MASPGKLRLLGALREGEIDEIRPTVEVESGAVAYPDADEYLDAREGETFDALEELAERGLLDREFQEKQYICPRCETKGMQYTTACPICESPQTVRTDRYRHVECGFEGVREQFAEGDATEEGAVVCPGCETEVASWHTLENEATNVCEECTESFETPAHRLRCRECRHVAPPLDTIERVLYRYYVSDDGVRWVDDQLAARQSVAEIFEDRNLHVEIDTTVTDGSGTEVPVHVYGKDELLDDRVVAAVHERPDEADVRALRDLAAGVDARATLVTTSGEVVGAAAGPELSGDGFTVLSVHGDELRREYDVVDGDDVGGSFVGRLAGIFRTQNG